MSKTHWLQSPNKNYLGHWDLPNGEDIVLTIESAQWEEVKNPITNKKEAKRVIRFKDKGYKPMICNQGNAQSIIKSTGIKFMEDASGSKIQLYVGLHSDRRTKENIDCIRVRNSITISPKVVLDKLSALFIEAELVLNEDDKGNVKAVIDNKDEVNYDRAINFLNKKLGR